MSGVMHWGGSGPVLVLGAEPNFFLGTPGQGSLLQQTSPRPGCLPTQKSFPSGRSLASIARPRLPTRCSTSAQASCGCSCPCGGPERLKGLHLVLASGSWLPLRPEFTGASEEREGNVGVCMGHSLPCHPSSHPWGLSSMWRPHFTSALLPRKP